MPFIKKRNLRIFLKNTVRLSHSEFTAKRSRTFLSFVKTIVQWKKQRCHLKKINYNNKTQIWSACVLIVCLYSFWTDILILIVFYFGICSSSWFFQKKQTPAKMSICRKFLTSSYFRKVTEIKLITSSISFGNLRTCDWLFHMRCPK